jgi:two-component system sensor histidine kinase KdpD
VRGASSIARLARWVRTGWLQALAAVAVATALSSAMSRYFDPANLVMTYLLAVVVVAFRYGRGPSVFASVLSVAAFDFFFVPPYLTFVVAETQYLVTFAVMLTVALVISGLTARIQRQAASARHREERTAALYAMSRELAEAAAVGDLVAIASRHIAAVFDGEVAVVLVDSSGRLPAEHVPSNRAVDLPLVGQRGSLGVMRIRPRNRDVLSAPESRRQLETFVNQTALAVERARLADEAQDARVRAETERLRSSLLTSVSHDLRTPLATITGAATTMLESGDRLEPRTQHELLESIRGEADRLNRIVHNLLEMTRLESGGLHLRREWHPLEEVVGAALGQLAHQLGSRRVTVNVPADLPLVPIDDVLIEQLLVNLLDNAVKYTAPDAGIRIIASATDTSVTVEVADRGPGLPRGEEDHVFGKFYRATADGRRGAGLGLAICRGIVQAHGGRIWAQNLPEGGVAFLFTLPLTGTPPLAVPDDA